MLQPLGVVQWFHGLPRRWVAECLDCWLRCLGRGDSRLLEEAAACLRRIPVARLHAHLLPPLS